MLPKWVINVNQNEMALSRNKQREKEIFFHVGLGKTGTKFLQDQVFPYFRDIEYIHRNYRYKRAPQIIKFGKSDRYLVSREFDQQFEREVSKFAKSFPDTTIIIVFRRQDQWIASQYRRFVKNGHFIPFEEFFDVKNDRGLFKKTDLTYMRYLEIIERHFTKEPLILLYQDLVDDPMGFIDKIAERVGVSYDNSKINLKRKHTSYSEKQLKVLRSVGKFVNVKKDESGGIFKTMLSRFYTNTIRYNTLYLAKYLPDSMVDDDPLIPAEQLREVREYFEDDWNAILKTVSGQGETE